MGYHRQVPSPMVITKEGINKDMEQQQQKPQYTEEQLKEIIKQQQDPRHNQE